MGAPRGFRNCHVQAGSTWALVHNDYPTPEPLVAGGNASGPKARLSDFEVDSESAMVGPYAPTGPLDPTVHGLSTFTSIEAAERQLNKTNAWRLGAGAELPPGIGVHADGADVGGNAPQGHRLLYPTERMSVESFNVRINAAGFVRDGKING